MKPAPLRVWLVQLTVFGFGILGGIAFMVARNEMKPQYVLTEDVAIEDTLAFGMPGPMRCTLPAGTVYTVRFLKGSVDYISIPLAVREGSIPSRVSDG